MLLMPAVGGPAVPAMFCPPRVRHQQHCTKPACPDQPSVKTLAHLRLPCLQLYHASHASSSTMPPMPCISTMPPMHLYHASHAVSYCCGWFAWIETALHLPPPCMPQSQGSSHCTRSATTQTTANALQPTTSRLKHPCRPMYPLQQGQRRTTTASTLPTNVPSAARSKACHHGLHTVRVLALYMSNNQNYNRTGPHQHMCKGCTTSAHPSDHTSPKVQLKAPNWPKTPKSFYPHA